MFANESWYKHRKTEKCRADRVRNVNMSLSPKPRSQWAWDKRKSQKAEGITKGCKGQEGLGISISIPWNQKIRKWIVLPQINLISGVSHGNGLTQPSTSHDSTGKWSSLVQMVNSVQMISENLRIWFLAFRHLDFPSTHFSTPVGAYLTAVCLCHCGPRSASRVRPGPALPLPRLCSRHGRPRDPWPARDCVARHRPLA